MIVQKQALLAAMELPASITSKRMTLPILAAILIEAKDGTLTVKGTSLDQSARSSCECSGDLEPICVNTASFLRTIEFGGDEIAMTIAKGSLVVQNGSKTNLPILEASQFPLTFNEPAKNIGVNCVDLATAIKAVKWCCADGQDQRFVLQHVHAEGCATKITAEASAGAQLAERIIDSISAEFDTMIHSDFAANFVRALMCDGAVFALSDGHARVEHSSGAFECKLPDKGQFPNTEPILGNARTPIGEIDRDEWKSVFEYIASSWPNITEEVGGRATIQFWSNTCHISCETGGFSFDKSIAGKFEKCECKTNAVALRDCLSAFPIGSKLKLSHSEVAFVFEHDGMTVVRQLVGVVKNTPKP